MGLDPRRSTDIWRGGIPGRPSPREIWSELRREDGVGFDGNPSMVLWGRSSRRMVWEVPSEGD